MVEIIRTLMLCGTIILLAFMILIALPKSKFRNFVLQIVGWGMTIFCGVYTVCPIDVIPDFIPGLGFLDDGGAIIGGIASAIMARQAGKELKEMK